MLSIIVSTPSGSFKADSLYLFSCELSKRAGGGVFLYEKPHLHPQIITKPQISNIDIKYVQILSGPEKNLLSL